MSFLQEIKDYIEQYTETRLSSHGELKNSLLIPKIYGSEKSEKHKSKSII